MIFQSIRIKEGISERTIDFTEKVNLIHSQKNSRGKTTLLRFLLYSLGYNIPNTRKIKFERCEVEVKLLCDSNSEITILRYNNDFIVATIKETEITFVLPDQINALHKEIYGTDNSDILNNILGSFYVDQEKGWTLLNRGVAIGSIHFNIEELVRGLSGRDCSALIKKEVQLTKELGKYRQMFSVAKYQESIIAETGSLSINSYEEVSNVMMNQLSLRQKNLKSELNRIDRTLNDNKRFRRFVSELKLLIQTPDGLVMPVTEESIVGLNDTIDFLVAKRKIVSSELAMIAKQLIDVENEKESETQQLAFYQSENMLEIFDRKIASVPINAIALNKEIGNLEKAVKLIRKEISDKTKTNNTIITSMYKNVVKYLLELDVNDNDTIATAYLFTSNLKELSGAILHKTVFAFRLAYIIEIEKVLGIKLPIILDSPSGKEIDQTNIQLMVDILKRDFSDNQIIIASIFQYDFDSVNIIEIRNRLIE